MADYISQITLPDNNTYDIKAKALSNISLTSTTINNTAGSFAFSGSGAPWAGTDWVGLQIGDNVDKFQISAGGAGTNSLLFRQNDNGGTNTSWGNWQMLGHATSGTAVGNDATPIYMSSDGTLKAGTALGASAYHADSYFAAASHGNHVPTTQTANNITFLRNDNSWYKLTKNEVNTLINLLDTGSSDLTANDYVITQYVGGGTTTTSYHRRPASKVINATLVKAALGTVSTTAKKFLKDTGSWIQVDWGDLTGVPNSFTPSTHEHNRLNGIGRLTTATAISYNPGASQGLRLVWNLYDSTSRTNDATNSPSFDAGVINIPWDWGGYNGQIAISNTIKDNTRMQIRSASHIDNGENANPRYTPNYGAWREVVTATKATKVGDTNKPIYINATGQATAISYTIEKSVPSNAVFTDTNKYHKTGSWGGTNNLTYTATAVNNADELAFTLSTASTSAYGTTKLYDGVDSTSTTLAATANAVKAAYDKADGLLAAADAMVFKGTLGTGGTITALPATHNAGDTYRVITAGDWAGKYCEVGTLIICVKDGTTATDSDWTSVETNEDGAVIGPAEADSTTDNAIVRWDSTTGRVIQNSKVIIDDNGCISTTQSSTTDTNYKVTNSNGSVGIYTSTNRGLYDFTKSGWIIYRAQNGNNTYIPQWASKGSSTLPIYFNSSGEPASISSISLNLTANTNSDNAAGFKIFSGEKKYANYYLNTKGTTSTVGIAAISLGNQIAAQTADNAKGVIWLYGTGTKATQIETTFSGTNAHSVMYFPNHAGPGYLVHTSSNEKVGDSNQPVYIAANGRVTACTALGTASTHADTDFATSGHNHNSTYLTAVGYDSTNKKIYYTKNGSNTDVVTVATLKTALGSMTPAAHEHDYIGNTRFIAYPSDGHYDGQGNSVTGYIKIKIPKTKSATMLSFDVDIYNYHIDTTVRYHIAGYNYSNASWNHTTAYCIAPVTNSKANLTVRFLSNGNDEMYVTIGETNTVWSYPKVSVHNIVMGHNGNTLANWSSGWTITISTTAFDTNLVKVTKNNTNIAYVTTGAKLTTTSNAIAYYTDDEGTFGSKASANGALYATAANGALSWGTLPVAQGGTGATSAENARTNLGLGTAATYNIVGTGNNNGYSSTEILIPRILKDGVMEVGKYIDFHASAGDSKDYDVRITAATTGLTIGGTTSGTFSGSLTGNATTCSYPAGFSSRNTNATWGNQTGTTVTSWNEANGGSIDFRCNNPSSGKLSIKVDGRFYGNEGTYPTMLMRNENNYWGLCDPDAANNVWIRTTTLGILPYQSGGEGGGHCGLGTSSWYFSSAYVDTAYNTKVIIKNKVTLQWNETDQSLDFIFA